MQISVGFGDKQPSKYGANGLNYLIFKIGLYKELPKKNKPLAPDSSTGTKLPHVNKVSKAAEHPDAHIPLSEWIKWREWNKP